MVGAVSSNAPVRSHTHALRVADLEASIAFYTKLFGTQPAKLRPGYANFAITEPPLKLVLLEGESGEATRMDHLGVEVETTDQVTAATQRLADQGLDTAVEDNTTCCYAVQDKVWVNGPGSEPWEVYRSRCAGPRHRANPGARQRGGSNRSGTEPLRGQGRRQQPDQGDRLDLLHSGGDRHSRGREGAGRHGRLSLLLTTRTTTGTLPLTRKSAGALSDVGQRTADDRTRASSGTALSFMVQRPGQAEAGACRLARSAARNSTAAPNEHSATVRSTGV
jgi:catechol 2,3-dioxygenase-like lactoylglutathione lyase family enzyme